MVEAQYQQFKNSEIPKPGQGGVSAAVISAEVLGAKVCVTVRDSVCVTATFVGCSGQKGKAEKQ